MEELDLFVDGIISIVNFLIYILIFMKAIGTSFFNLFDLTELLMGISAGGIWLFVKVLR